MRFHWTFVIPTIFIFLSLKSFATSNTELSKFRGSISVTSKSLKSSRGLKTNAKGAELEMQYGLRPSYGINLMMKQLALDSNGSVTGFAFGGHYSFNGLLHQKKSSRTYGETVIVEKSSKNSQDLILKAGVSQYLFNGTIAVTGFFGYFFGGDYLYPLTETMSLQAGVFYDSVENVTSISILSFNAGLNFLF